MKKNKEVEGTNRADKSEEGFDKELWLEEKQ